jgi:hypothetical protein
VTAVRARIRRDLAAIERAIERVAEGRAAPVEVEPRPATTQPRAKRVKVTVAGPATIVVGEGGEIEIAREARGPSPGEKPPHEGCEK